MNKGVIFLFVLIALIIGGFVFFYFYFEFNTDEEIMSNVTIFALNDGERVIVNYTIQTLLGNITGRTYEQGGVMYQIPVNRSFTIFNTGTDYYKEEIFIANNVPANHRINLNLEKPGTVRFYQYGTFAIHKDITLKTVIEGELKDVRLCFDWSTRIIFAELDNYSSIDKGEFNRCYKIGDLKDEEREFLIKYKDFSILNDKDFINVHLIDTLNNKKTHIIKLPDNIFIE